MPLETAGPFISRRNRQVAMGPVIAAASVGGIQMRGLRRNQYAQYMLGKLYLAGREVLHDEDRGVYWLTKSAEQDNQYAQYLLNHLEENRPPSAMLAVTRLLHHMSRVFRDSSVPKSRPGGIQIDRKRLKKLQEKRMALGHKPDDHEEQWPDMTM